MNVRIFFLTASVLAMAGAPAHAWWEATHQRVVAGATAMLPAPLKGFFAQYEDAMKAHAGDSDKMRHTRKHSMDWFDLEGVSAYPFTDVPAVRNTADSLYGREALEKDIGILPWNAADEYRTMVNGFKKGNYDLTVRTAVHLAHHIADAHMPFHTTLNYNGAPLGHKGVHTRIEAVCEEGLTAVATAGNLQPAEIAYPFEAVMDALRRGNGRVFQMLYADAAAHEKGLVEDPKLEQGKPAYAAFIMERLGGMFGMCLDEAAVLTAGLWLAAWEDAGTPELPGNAVPLTWEIEAQGAEHE